MFVQTRLVMDGGAHDDWQSYYNERGQEIVDSGSMYVRCPTSTVDGGAP